MFFFSSESGDVPPLYESTKFVFSERLPFLKLTASYAPENHRLEDEISIWGIFLPMFRGKLFVFRECTECIPTFRYMNLSLNAGSRKNTHWNILVIYLLGVLIPSPAGYLINREGEESFHL